MLLKPYYVRLGEPGDDTLTEVRESITLTDPHRHKFADAITEYIYDNMESWAEDGHSGDAECPVGWFARSMSKRIIRGDERGFVWTEKFANEYERDLVYDALCGVYYAWDDDGEDMYGDGDVLLDDAERDYERQIALDERTEYLSYVYECDRDQTTPYDFDTWLYRALKDDRDKAHTDAVHEAQRYQL